VNLDQLADLLSGPPGPNAIKTVLSLDADPDP
jgi:hypothetical protein